MSNDFDAIIANAEAHEQAMLLASQAILEDWAEETTAWERENRPWQDHTKRARLGLSFVREFPDDPRDPTDVALVHGAPYGRALEERNGGEYAIIGPAVAIFGPALLNDLENIWHD